MQYHRILGALTFCGAAALAGACTSQPEAPAAEVQSQQATASNTPTTISGCLKAGEAADTFVLTAAKTEGSADTATYQLVGAEGVNLRDQVGRQVEVSGVVDQQQQTASRSDSTPADRAAGTSGTPTVQTRTEIDIKQLRVTNVKPLGERCDM